MRDFWATIALALFGVAAIGTLVYEALHVPNSPRLDCPETAAWDGGDEPHCAPAARDVRFLLERLRGGDALPGDTVFLLSSLGSQAVPCLVQSFRDPNDQIVSASVKTVALLGRRHLLGIEATRTADALTMLIHHPSDSVRFDAALALCYCGRARVLGIPELVGALDDESWRVRACAARVLGRMGADAKVARPRLERLTTDTNAFARRQAQIALGRIGGPAPEKLSANP